jgi:hypothetical protein
MQRNHSDRRCGRPALMVNETWLLLIPGVFAGVLEHLCSNPERSFHIPKIQPSEEI